MCELQMLFTTDGQEQQAPYNSTQVPETWYSFDDGAKLSQSVYPPSLPSQAKTNVIRGNGSLNHLAKHSLASLRSLYASYMARACMTASARQISIGIS